MIAVIYIGEPRYRDLTRLNHETLFDQLRSNWPIQTYDFTHGAWDRSRCPFELSGQIQVWDWYESVAKITEPYVIKLRTDVWFGPGAVQAVLSELTNIVSGAQDISYLGAELYEDFATEYNRILAGKMVKIQDYCVIADKRRVRPQQEVYNEMLTGKQYKSGNRTWRYLATDHSRCYSVRCQMYLVRDHPREVTDWQIGYDFVRSFDKCDKAQAWWELNRPVKC